MNNQINISPDEAEEALAAVKKIMNKSRHTIANSGIYIFLIITGIIWLIGFLANQFMSGKIVVYIWIGMSILGSGLSVLLGRCMDKRVRGPSTALYIKRIGIFWLFLIFFCVAVIAVAQPVDGKQMTMLIILFIMAGQMAMGLLFSFSSTWWVLPLTALALAGYFLLPDYFYLWMSVLVGGGMILLGLYVHFRW